jgi:hypothetical protein
MTTTTETTITAEQIDRARPACTWLQGARHATLARHLLRQPGWIFLSAEPTPGGSGVSTWGAQLPAFVLVQPPAGTYVFAPGSNIVRFMRDGFLVITGPDRDAVADQIALVRATDIAEREDAAYPGYQRDSRLRDIPSFLRD